MPIMKLGLVFTAKQFGSCLLQNISWENRPLQNPQRMMRFVESLLTGKPYSSFKSKENSLHFSYFGWSGSRSEKSFKPVNQRVDIMMNEGY
jgi:hypothetical protein